MQRVLMVLLVDYFLAYRFAIDYAMVSDRWHSVRG